jgi:hypothetical protein
MKIALPCQVSKTPIHLLGSSVPKRRQNRLHCRSKLSQRRPPTPKPQPKTAVPLAALTGKSPRIGTAFPYPSIQTSNGNPGSFNPELCGGSLPSQTLAR